MCFAVDIIGLIFGVNNFLAAVESIVSGKHVAECNGKQKVRHAVIAEQLKADEQGSDRAVCHTTELRPCRLPYRVSVKSLTGFQTDSQMPPR
mgnify:CR=1 FL=1